MKTSLAKVNNNAYNCWHKREQKHITNEFKVAVKDWVRYVK